MVTHIPEKAPCNPRRLLLFIWCLAFFFMDAHAQALESTDLFARILNDYKTASTNWSEIITNAASWLFWLLATISMVWTFGMMALRKADIGDFFAEFVRFTIFTGFFWWLLTNGPNFSDSIYRSLRKIGGDATGLGQDLNPSSIVDIGFFTLEKVISKVALWDNVDKPIMLTLAVGILIILVLIGTNMLLLLVSAWVLAYGGVFFLGFGGSRWTSDMAINYYKTVLAVAAQLFTMVLITGIGQVFLKNSYDRIQSGDVYFNDLTIILVTCIILLTLINKIPRLISGIAINTSIGSIGNFWTGSVIGATGMTGTAVSTTGATLAAGVSSASDDVRAVMTTYSNAREHISSSPGAPSSFLKTEDGYFPERAEYETGTPLSKAAGFKNKVNT